MDTLVNFEIEKVSTDLLKIMFECNKRGLRNSCSWAAELYYSLSKSGINIDAVCVSDCIEECEFAMISLAKSHYDNQEYDRAASFTLNCHTPEGRFLHFYSVYCAGEKKRIDGIVDVSVPADKTKNFDLKSLRAKLHKEHIKGSLDGYCLYLYGVVLKKLQLDKQAVEILCQAIRMEPLHWGSWLELATLIVDREMLNNLCLPDHWMKNFFLAHTYLELQMNELALEIYVKLLEVGFNNSTYLMAQIAIGYHNMRDLEKAISGFQEVLEVDPYRLDNLDIYSNLLYVREMRLELSNLAQDSCSIDQYRVETCCVIGNFYSLRTQHEKAVIYFQRALRLNPNYLSAWTLMGHEYMEMKNTSFAIQAYRQAIEVNRRDYRAWYGLGQTYEMLKMSYYCLYYYRQAQLLRPHDSRMMVALGEAYEKLDKVEEAKKCFWKAHIVGDIEGVAVLKLAKVHEKLNEEKQAAIAFTNYTQGARAKGTSDREDLCHAYLFLSKYYLKIGDLESSYENTLQCLEFPDTKEEAKDILRQIETRRDEMEDKNCDFHFDIEDNDESLCITDNYDSLCITDNDESLGLTDFTIL